MSREDFGAEYGSEWVCSQQRQHILDDPEHWSVYVVDHDLGDGKTYTGPISAHSLTHGELLRALDIMVPTVGGPFADEVPVPVYGSRDA